MTRFFSTSFPVSDILVFPLARFALYAFNYFLAEQAVFPERKERRVGDKKEL